MNVPAMVAIKVELIAMIQVDPAYRRDGIATVLAARLFADSPRGLVAGLVTDDGAKWWDRVKDVLGPKTITPDPPVVRNTFDDVLAAAPNILEEAKVNARNDGDPWLKQIYKVLGYDALPDVIDSDDFDALIARGSIPLYRGLYGGGLDIAALIDDFRYGNYYAGKGIHGNGTYLGTDHRTALAYGGLGGANNVFRLVISPNARVIDQEELHREYLAFTRSGAFDALSPDVQDLLLDEGRFAAALGYDAIRVPGAAGDSDYYVVLNRGVIIVDRNNGFGKKRIDSRSLREEHSVFMDSAFYDSLTEEQREPWRDRYYYAASRGYDFVLESEGEPIKDIRWIRDRYFKGAR
jgi:GNAT superfamily N-acetyltransferase